MKISCPKCGKVLKAPEEMAGKKGQCPSCGAVLLMPSAPPPTPEACQGLSGLDLVGAYTGDPHVSESVHAASHHEPVNKRPGGGAATMKITCPKCKNVLKAPVAMAGKKGQCPSCGAVLLMPSAPPVSSPEASEGLSGLGLVGAYTSDAHAHEPVHAASHHEPVNKRPGGGAATMKITCPKCKNVLKAPVAMAGRKGQCPSCGAVLLMPSAPPVSSPETSEGLSGLGLVGAYTSDVHAHEPVHAASHHEPTKAFELPESDDGLLRLLASIDARAPAMTAEAWAPIRCAAEALLKRGHAEAVAPVMKAWACVTQKLHLTINHDAIALLEKCGPVGVTTLCEVLEHWLGVCSPGSPRCSKAKEDFLPVLEALERLGREASPSRALIVRCLAFEHSDSAFVAQVQAIADRIAWNIDLYALE